MFNYRSEFFFKHNITVMLFKVYLILINVQRFEKYIILITKQNNC